MDSGIAKANGTADTVAGVPNELDKKRLYSKFQAGEDREAKHEDRKRDLGLKVAAKALDIALVSDEPMNIDARKLDKRSGVGPLGVAGIVATAGIIPTAALIAGMFLAGRPAKDPVVMPKDQAKETTKVLRGEADVKAGTAIIERPTE